MVDWLLERMRRWDRETSSRVSHFIAISKTVQQRIAECYGRQSVVIYPPVDTDFYCPTPLPREDYYLIVSAFAPYKRLDLAIEVCNRLGRRLLIIGTGQDEARLRSLAGPTVTFLGWQPDAVIRDQMRRCRALLFPGEEDFGIVPLERTAAALPSSPWARAGPRKPSCHPGPDASRPGTGSPSRPPTAWPTPSWASRPGPATSTPPPPAGRRSSSIGLDSLTNSSRFSTAFCWKDVQTERWPDPSRSSLIGPETPPGKVINPKSAIPYNHRTRNSLLEFAEQTNQIVSENRQYRNVKLSRKNRKIGKFTVAILVHF